MISALFVHPFLQFLTHLHDDRGLVDRNIELDATDLPEQVVGNTAPLPYSRAHSPSVTLPAGPAPSTDPLPWALAARLPPRPTERSRTHIPPPAITKLDPQVTPPSALDLDREAPPISADHFLEFGAGHRGLEGREARGVAGGMVRLVVGVISCWLWSLPRFPWMVDLRIGRQGRHSSAPVV